MYMLFIVCLLLFVWLPTLLYAVYRNCKENWKAEVEFTERYAEPAAVKESEL